MLQKQKSSTGIQLQLNWNQTLFGLIWQQNKCEELTLWDIGQSLTDSGTVFFLICVYGEYKNVVSSNIFLWNLRAPVLLSFYPPTEDKSLLKPKTWIPCIKWTPSWLDVLHLNGYGYKYLVWVATWCVGFVLVSTNTGIFLPSWMLVLFYLSISSL